MQLFMVMAIEKVRTIMAIEKPRTSVMGFILIPRKLLIVFSFLKTASKPPVVLVVVTANKSSVICPAT